MSVSNFTDWANVIWQQLAKVPLAVWKSLLCLLLVAWMAVTAADAFWLLLRPSLSPLSPVTYINAGGVSAPSAGGQSVDIDALAGLHLFGDADEEALANNVLDEQQIVDEDAPDTNLALKLMGVVAGEGGDGGGAIISNQGKEAYYKINEKLPVSGNVKLVKVFVDRAIINNNGRDEKLSLYDEDGGYGSIAVSNAGQAPQARSTPAPRPSTAPRQRINQLRQQMLDNPQSLADVIRPSVKREGDTVLGYTVRPGRHREAFDALGLQPNDLVTTVNGIVLDDPSKALQLYKTLRETTSAEVTIIREGQEMLLSLNISDSDPASSGEILEEDADTE